MHSQRDFNKVSQQQFRGVCDQDCTVILLKVPSKWFLATAVGSARRVTRHMGQILAPVRSTNSIPFWFRTILRVFFLFYSCHFLRFKRRKTFFTTCKTYIFEWNFYFSRNLIKLIKFIYHRHKLYLFLVVKKAFKNKSSLFFYFYRIDKNVEK